MAEGKDTKYDWVDVDDVGSLNKGQMEKFLKFAELDEDDEEVEEDLAEPETISFIEQHQSLRPRVVNIVAIVDYGVEFDLAYVARTARNAEYNPRRLGACILRIDEPKATALVFRAKMNIIGCRREEDAELAARKFGRVMRNLGYKFTKWKSFELKSFVAVIACPFKLKLEAIASHPECRLFAEYHPERYAGCTYRIPDPRVTLLIFQSGKIVMTGARSRQMLHDAVEWIYPIIRMFQKTDPLAELQTVEEPVAEEAPAPVEVKTEPVKKKKIFGRARG